MDLKLVRFFCTIFVLAGLVAISPTMPLAQGTQQNAHEKMDSPPGPPPHGKKGPDGFEKDDVDKDGKVTREEFSGPADMFDHLDANGDGVITREEAKPPQDGQGAPPGKEAQQQ
jgi:hypothetical protein